MIVPVVVAVLVVVVVVVVVMAVVAVRVTAACRSSPSWSSRAAVVGTLVRTAVVVALVRARRGWRHQRQRESRLRPVDDEQEPAQGSAERAADVHAVLREAAVCASPMLNSYARLIRGWMPAVHRLHEARRLRLKGRGAACQDHFDAQGLQKQRATRISTTEETLVLWLVRCWVLASDPS